MLQAFCSRRRGMRGVSVAAGGLDLLGRELFDAAGRVTNNEVPVVRRPAFVIPCILAAVDRTLAFHPYTGALQAAITCEISDVGLASRPLSCAAHFGCSSQACQQPTKLPVCGLYQDPARVAHYTPIPTLPR